MPVSLSYHMAICTSSLMSMGRTTLNTFCPCPCSDTVGHIAGGCWHDTASTCTRGCLHMFKTSQHFHYHLHLGLPAFLGFVLPAAAPSSFLLPQAAPLKPHSSGSASCSGSRCLCAALLRTHRCAHTHTPLTTGTASAHYTCTGGWMPRGPILYLPAWQLLVPACPRE